MKSGRTHVQRYLEPLMKFIQDGKLDTTFAISHRLPLEEAPEGYEMLNEKQNETTEVVLKTQ